MARKKFMKRGWNEIKFGGNARLNGVLARRDEKKEAAVCGTAPSLILLLLFI